ncbi:glycosyltransferase, partial [Candidatus Babeliales bacterium]|nr:glycosyltransferase [Candidatus Babeliales bacterium]
TIYSPKRLVANVELAERSLQLADHCSLVGNKYTLSTYPQKYHAKITPVNISGSVLRYKKSPKDFVPQEKEFLWFFGSGAVHKGLDLVLDVFLKNKDLKLNIVGNAVEEKDFLLVYKDKIERSPNITYHGYLHPQSKEFTEITRRCFCFVATSCSESTSSACATCLQAGLYPIISYDCGVTLPQNCGIYLKTCSHEEIESALSAVYHEPTESLAKQIQSCQARALQNYSRQAFSKRMTNFLQSAIGSQHAFEKNKKSSFVSI